MREDAGTPHTDSYSESREHCPQAALRSPASEGSLARLKDSPQDPLFIASTLSSVSKQLSDLVRCRILSHNYI